MIPKIIHFCWLSSAPYPEKIQRCINTWKKFLPDYKFVHWNFDRFPRGKSLWVDQAFDSHKYAYAADYIRLYALYNFGGIYLDTDVEVLKSFDDLLNLPYFIGQEPSETGIEAAVLGFEKGNKLIKDMLDTYEGKSFINPDGSMNVYPLPYRFRACIDAQYTYHPIECMDDFIYQDDIVNIFPVDYFSPKDFHTLQITTTDRTYSIHHFAGSWLKNSTKESWNVFVARWRRRILKALSWRTNFIIMSNSAIDSMYDVSFTRCNHSPLYNVQISEIDFLALLELRNRWKTFKLHPIKRTESKYADRIDKYYPILGIEGTNIELHFTSTFSLEQAYRTWNEGLISLQHHKLYTFFVSNNEVNIKKYFSLNLQHTYLITSLSSLENNKKVLFVTDTQCCNAKGDNRNKLMLRICRLICY